MDQVLSLINNAVWGIPLLILIISVGVLLSIKTRFAQLRFFSDAIRCFFKNQTSKRELFTALAATIGTGNLAGVAGAISIGGPGAIFWMWVCGLIGMMTKFAETILSVYYRKKTESGEYIGGPMYVITQALPKGSHWLAYLYCFLGAVAVFGVGNATQINAAIGSIEIALNAFHITTSISFRLGLGVIFALLVFLGLRSGTGNIGKIAEKLVPFAAFSYLLISIVALIKNSNQIFPIIRSIVEGAFSPASVTGGTVGSAFIALRTGASRGVFTNEAGMGTAGIAHAEAKVEHPVQQGLLGIIEVFIDTILICTMTAFVILSSNVPIPFGIDQGIQLTSLAFSTMYGPWASILIAVVVCCFALATVFGWSLYGGRCIQFLFGNRFWRFFLLAQVGVVIICSIMNTGTVWIFSEIVNGLMAVPNLISLICLCPKVSELCNEYQHRYKESRRLV